jgi:hypothetical protein
MRLRFLHWLTGLSLTAALIGCGGGSTSRATLAPPYPVQGRIIFADKTPLKGGVIYFNPVEATSSSGGRYQAAGLIDASGKYKIGFSGNDKGAPEGEYKVTIVPRDYQELQGSNSGRIPARYREVASTPLTATVKEADNVFDFEIK